MKRSKNILVTGSFDLLHSGHIAFLKTAAKYGNVYVGIGSDASIRQLKNRATIYSEQERLFLVRAIRYVEGAWINKGMGNMDFAEGFEQDNPFHFDMLIVNEDQDIPEKYTFCENYGMEYVVLKRESEVGLPIRSSTALRSNIQVKEYLGKLIKAITDLKWTEISQLIDVLLDIRKNNSTIYVCGNGGSGSTASHFACDLNKLGGFKVISLNDNMSLLTAYANDIDYDFVFVEPLKILMQKGDILIGISGSGNSANILKAISYANDIDNVTCGLTGYDGGQLKKLAKYSINANVNDMQISEDVHLILTHLLTRILGDIKWKNGQQK